MKEYQKKKCKVNRSVGILNEEIVLETATQGLFRLCLETGMEVMRQILELDVEELAGKKGCHDPERTAYRHGYENTKVVLNGRKQTVQKPRVRSTEGTELPLPSLAWFQAEDTLNEEILR